MSTGVYEEFKHWTAKRKAPLVTYIIQGKTTVAEASRTWSNACAGIGSRPCCMPAELLQMDWLHDTRRPNQALGMKTPAKAYA